ncbi:MAG: ATP-dependent 6-phosphofructokinase [Spirochaetales bacterium]|jgi:6-phosphofructokinase 1|nr:ATP-dependent 6-phosphofructokinase [Spirochaetales bacterium]
MNAKLNFTIPTLGPAKVPSPIKMSKIQGDRLVNYITDDDTYIYDLIARPGDPRKSYRREEMMEKAGPREMLYFSPGHVHAGIITCGGLCPGLNNVIRAIVRALWYLYGVKRITGIRYGYRGFLPEYNLPTVELNPQQVEVIHEMGGTILGSSRGGSDTEAIADSIERMNINILFTIGGDGTTKGALAIAAALEERKYKCAIVGVPKTIDNDLSFIQKSFGFETAVTLAVHAVQSAYVEARDALNGIGLVKLMGRESGFIAAHTALAMPAVNFCLIPEIPFDLEGPKGLIAAIEKRLGENKSVVIVAAEGAGQEHLNANTEKDLSGNKKLSDIGQFLNVKLQEYFKKKNIEISIKYIDPSYMIRSAPAAATDSIYCLRLGTNAVHAAMAGKTKVLMSQLNDQYVHIPMELAVARRNYVDPESSLWSTVLEATRQPETMKNDPPAAP